MLWLSLGENCLADNVLSRHGLKSFSTPYSHGRTNIDYVLALEANGYAGLLDREKLAHATVGKRQVVRSLAYIQCDGIFERSVSKGFEFTHHDVITDEEARDSAFRKMERMKAARGAEDIAFLYHHRFTPTSDFLKLMTKLEKFADLYSENGRQCHVFVMGQNIVQRHENRRLECAETRPSVTRFVFHTENVWGGDNEDHLWARCDEDLIEDMLNHAAKLLKERAHHIAPKMKAISSS